MKRVTNLVGRKFTRLSVISGPFFKYNQRHEYYKCVCDCGAEREVKAANLLAGVTKSCGCYSHDLCKKKSTTHGMSKTPEHSVWKNMNRRCDTPSVGHFHRYGGRGIKVCDEWRHSFETFYRDMGPRPSPEHTIERIDNDGDYCKENCMWLHKSKQALNTSRTTVAKELVTFNGKSMTLRDWSVLLGIDYGTLKARVHRYKLPLHIAFRPERLRERTATYNGKTQSIRKWTDELGLDYGTVAQRIASGMPPEKAFVKNVNYSVRLLTYNGKTQSMADWARELGIRQDVLERRINLLKLPLEEAFYQGDLRKRRIKHAVVL